MAQGTWQYVDPERRVTLLLEILDKLVVERRADAETSTGFAKGLYMGGAGAYELCAQWLRDALT